MIFFNTFTFSFSQESDLPVTYYSERKVTCQVLRLLLITLLSARSKEECRFNRNFLPIAQGTSGLMRRVCWMANQLNGSYQSRFLSFSDICIDNLIFLPDEVSYRQIFVWRITMELYSRSEPSFSARIQPYFVSETGFFFEKKPLFLRMAPACHPGLRSVWQALLPEYRCCGDSYPRRYSPRCPAPPDAGRGSGSWTCRTFLFML